MSREANATVRLVPSVYDDIGSAVSASSPGDTILVGGGHIEEEGVGINKSLLITSDSGTLPTLEGEVSITAGDVTIRGMTVEAGVATTGSGALTIEDCEFTGEIGTPFGAILMSSFQDPPITVRRSKFTSLERGVTGDVITQVGCSPCCFGSLIDLVVEECVFTDVTYAITLGCGGNGDVSRCVFDGCGTVLDGLYYEYDTAFENNIGERLV